MLADFMCYSEFLYAGTSKINLQPKLKLKAPQKSSRNLGIIPKPINQKRKVCGILPITSTCQWQTETLKDLSIVRDGVTSPVPQKNGILRFSLFVCGRSLNSML